MSCKWIVIVACAAALLGCKDRQEAMAIRTQSGGLHADIAYDRAPSPVKSGANLAYSHQLDVEIAPDLIAARFKALTDLCHSDTTLECALLNAQVRNDPSSYGSAASLQVRLSHDGVAKFESAATAPAGEGRHGSVRVRSRSTSAEDLTMPLTDNERRLAQLSDYRDRLTALSKRADSKIDDLIKISGELSSTQQQIEQITADQANLTRRVQTEILNVEIYRKETVATAWEPVGSAFRDAGKTLGENVGEAVRFVIAALPFLPIIAIGIALASYGWRLFRRLQRGASPKANLSASVK